MKTFVVFALLTAAITIVFSENCTTILKTKNLFLQDNLNLTKYAGVWYEVRRNKTSSQHRGDCNRSKYTVIKGNNVTVKGELLAALNKQRTKTEQHGVLNITNAGQLTGNLTFINSATKNETDYWILKTNYNYSLVYSCLDIASDRAEESIIILSRNKTADDSSIKEALDELKKYGSGDPMLITTNQTAKCDELMGGGVPSLTSNGPIIFLLVIAHTLFTKLL